MNPAAGTDLELKGRDPADPAIPDKPVMTTLGTTQSLSTMVET